MAGVTPSTQVSFGQSYEASTSVFRLSPTLTRRCGKACNSYIVKRRYNRVSEYWKEPRNYKTLYPNVVDVVGHVARETAYRSRFHISRDLFNVVYQAIATHPLLQRTCQRKDFLTIEEQLGIFCTFAAQGGSFTQVALAMGCSITSVSRCVDSVATAIWDRLSDKIAWPANEVELQANVLGFQQLSGLVQVVGAIDGTHVRLASAPPNGGHNFYCHKGFHSIVAQAVVNHQGKAMDVHVGHAGRAHDAHVFTDSPVGEQLLDPDSPIAQALSRSMKRVGGVDVPYQLVADSAYPAREHVLPTFKNTVAANDPARAHFNDMHKKARIKIEHFWGWLKHKFRCCKCMTTRVETAVKVFMACCILLNMCIDEGEAVPQEVAAEAWLHYEQRLADDEAAMERLVRVLVMGCASWARAVVRLVLQRTPQPTPTPDSNSGLRTPTPTPSLERGPQLGAKKAKSLDAKTLAQRIDFIGSCSAAGFSETLCSIPLFGLAVMVTPEQRVEELQVSVRDVMKRIGMVKALPLDDPERQCLYDLDKQLTMLLKKQLLIMQEDGGCGVTV
ncbi:hypothetical protein QJQ45_005619 [Haematococcus lacustris]|nr:hypothetical protein QJQ45_005619 [Haematococcus lacustris]